MGRRATTLMMAVAVAVGATLAAGSVGSSSVGATTEGSSTGRSATVALGAPADVPEAVLTISTPAVAGTPSQYDKVQVRRFGSARAGHVLVLVPGTNGGAGDFDIIAPYLVTHVPDLQVWAEMRREGALQDDSVIRSTLGGRATFQQAFDYYFGWITDPTITHHYQPLSAADYQFVQQWGMAVAMNDLHAVIEKARDGGRRSVTLGGHSLGGTEAAVYGAWDFDGDPGYKDINGIVCIDGCAGTGFSQGQPPTVASVQQEITAMDTQGPWLDLLGLGPSFAWATGAFSQLGALAALEDPGGQAAFQQFPLLPQEFKPAKPVTNLAQLGYAFDASTSPAELALLHVHSGHVATSGDPAGWVNDGITPAQNIADAFAQAPLAAADWYYPERLSIDAGVAAPLVQTPVGTYLGLRLFDTSRVDVPLYAFQTSLGGTDNRVADGARYYQHLSKIPSVTVVSRKATYSHLDPLLATPSKNAFLHTVVPWLEKVDS